MLQKNLTKVAHAPFWNTWVTKENRLIRQHTKRIADNTLVALTLMIAESRTEEKDIMVKVVVNLINKNN